MSENFDLFYGQREISIREAFEQFHKENPQVLEALRRRALHAKRRDYRPGIKCLFEVMRWHHGTSTHGDEFKLNNNYTAHYARLLMRTTPELDGFFDLRELKT